MRAGWNDGERTAPDLAARVRDVYKQLDDAIGSFVARTRSDDLVLFISDHGFQSCTRAVHMDHLLRHFGIPAAHQRAP